MNEYLKELIKNSKEKNIKDFSAYVYLSLQKEIDSKKKKVDKNKYIKIRQSVLNYIFANERAITSELRKNKNK